MRSDDDMAHFEQQFEPGYHCPACGERVPFNIAHTCPQLKARIATLLKMWERS